MNREEYMLNEAKARMKKLYEYSFYRNGVFEDGEQDMNAGAPADPNMGMDPNMGGDPSMQGDTNAMGDDPNMGMDTNAMGGDPNMGMGTNMGGDPNMGGDINGANLAPNAGMDDPNMGGDPNAMGGDPNMGMDPMMGDEQPGPDDDVVDITALTDAQTEMQQSQEQIADQMSDVDQKLSTLMQVVDKFTSALEANDEKIRDLKRELVKRTPTEEETMNVRLNAGGNPFDQKPEEFWDKFKDINNHYNITANNEAPQYQIKKSDIDNFNDRVISDGMDDDDIPASLREYFDR